MDSEETTYNEIKEFIDRRLTRNRGRDAIRRKGRGDKMDVGAVREKDEPEKETEEGGEEEGGSLNAVGRGKGANPNIQCHKCQGKVHIGKDCPSTDFSMQKGTSCNTC